MGVTKNFSRRVLAALSASAVVTVASIAPALAAVRDDGDEPGDLLSTGMALFVFVGIPVLISAVVAVLALLPSWIKNAKANTVDGYLDNPAAKIVDATSHKAISQ